MIKVTDNEVTLNFTGDNIEGYASRLALSLILHDPKAFNPEDAQRLSTILDTIEDSFTEDDQEQMAKALRADAEELGQE